MAISEKKIYLRTGDTQTVYLKSVITDASIKIGDYTMYNDFVHDPRDFERNNVLYHYPINGNQLKIGKFCSIACGAKFLFTPQLPIYREVVESVKAELDVICFLLIVC